MYDLVIVGAGPAGLSAAIYGKRAGLQVLVLDTTAVSGGQVLTTFEVDNYLGMPGIGGMEMGKAFREHADRFAVPFETKQIRSIEQVDDYFVLQGRKYQIEAKAVILATGAKHAKLGCMGEDTYVGGGVSYCATCDGAFYKGLDVAVVGGGDVALEDAVFLSEICSSVTVILRRDSFRGNKALQDRLLQKENVRILKNSIVQEILGEDGRVKKIRLASSTGLALDIDEGTPEFLEVSGLFIAVGIIPESELAKPFADCDQNGYVLADESCKTRTPGFFVAGDIRRKPIRQIVTAVADGANAATAAALFLQGI